MFVVASFEMDDFHLKEAPQDKKQLIQMVKEGRVRQVHHDKWFPAHGPTRYDLWLSAQDVYQVEYHRDYEPYYIVRTDVPLYCPSC